MEKRYDRDFGVSTKLITMFRRNKPTATPLPIAPHIRPDGQAIRLLNRRNNSVACRTANGT